MKFYKNVFIPVEFNGKKQQAAVEQEQKSKETKEKAREALTRFEQSLEELDALLRRRRTDIDNNTGKLAYKSN